jgi:phage replication-related protein YjqB (UPF0714/DUF867 family)
LTGAVRWAGFDACLLSDDVQLPGEGKRNRCQRKKNHGSLHRCGISLYGSSVDRLSMLTELIAGNAAIGQWAFYPF